MVDQSYNILVVEDDPNYAMLTMAMLKRAGFEARHAQDGEVALSLAQESKPDLILLDLNLPGMSGWQLLDGIKEAYGEDSFRVIVTSAYNDSANRLVGKLQTVSHYLTKPFTPQQLIHVIGDVMEPSA